VCSCTRLSAGLLNIDCGKYTVREATNHEVWEWVRYAMEEQAENLDEALAYVGRLAS